MNKIRIDVESFNEKTIHFRKREKKSKVVKKLYRKESFYVESKGEKYLSTSKIRSISVHVLVAFTREWRNQNKVCHSFLYRFFFFSTSHPRNTTFTKYTEDLVRVFSLVSSLNRTTTGIRKKKCLEEKNLINYLACSSTILRYWLYVPKYTRRNRYETFFKVESPIFGQECSRRRRVGRGWKKNTISYPICHCLGLGLRYK